MRKPLVRFLIFLIANFSALYFGTLLMEDGPRTEWYLALNKAPWTPPGWVFGVVWTTIMLLFSFYMTKLTYQFETFSKKLLVLYTSQWLLNVSWNLFFFNMHNVEVGLIVIFSLWLLIGYYTFEYLKTMRFFTLLILPYLVWITIASTLNAYILVFN